MWRSPVRFLGTAPIRPYAYLVGKLSVLACWGVLVARYVWPGIVWFRSPGPDVLGAVLLVMGLLLLLTGAASLEAISQPHYWKGLTK
jgi:hypothetical protein